MPFSANGLFLAIPLFSNSSMLIAVGLRTGVGVRFIGPAEYVGVLFIGLGVGEIVLFTGLGVSKDVLSIYFSVGF